MDSADLSAGIVEAANAFRAGERRQALSTDPALAQAAQRFAEHMARTGKYGHGADGRTPVQRASAQGYRHCIVAENIAYQYKSTGFEDASRLASRFMQGWKESPGHRRNLLDPAVRETGVGVAQGSEGRWFAVQMFGLPESASIRFSVTNASAAQATYRIGGREYAIAPRVTRTHTMCRPPTLHLPGREQAVQPADGASYTIGDG